MSFPTTNTQFAYIKKIVMQFQELTNINLIYISTSFQLIDKNGFASNQQKLKEFMNEQSALAFFPLIANKSFRGFFILRLDKTSRNLLNLYRSSLETISKDNFNAYYQEIKILTPVRINQLNQLINMIHLILSYYQGNDLTYNDISKESNQGDEKDSINNALSYIENNIDQKISLFDISKKAYLSPAYLSRLFKEYFKINFSSYISTCKIALAQELLITTKKPIDSISKQIGFSRASYFNKVFKEKAGMTPFQFRKNYKGKKVYTIHRQIGWENNMSVYAITQHYFKEKNIPIEIQDINGYPYISSIGSYPSVNNNTGWVFTVDGLEPKALPSMVYVKDKSVIQWIYIDY